MTKYILSSQREGRFYVKQVSQEQYGKLVDCHHDIEYWNCVFDSSPEYLVEGSVTGKIGDSVEGFLRDTCHECKNSRICNLNDKCQWPIQVFVPRSASTVEPEKGRFKMPTDQQLLNTAILFNDGKIDKQKLADMVAMCEFVVNRLYENGDIAIPSSSEKE